MIGSFEHDLGIASTKAKAKGFAGALAWSSLASGWLSSLSLTRLSAAWIWPGSNDFVMDHLQSLEERLETGSGGSPELCLLSLGE
jgi:hypothetical protein